MLSVTLVLAAAARGQESTAKTEPVPVEAAKAAPKEFVPPGGWRPKKRGEFTVYCRKDYNVKGTRFPAETCYDEAGIRAMIEAGREDQTMVDKMRRICSGDASCGTR
jgi:hypothetical protein